MITAAIDSTTKRGVGQFATQGLSIGRDTPIPLPLLPIGGETTEEVNNEVYCHNNISYQAKSVGD